MEDDINVIEEQDLIEASNLTVILDWEGLDESMSLRTITSKCIIDWQISSEVSIIDIGNGFSLVKFISAFDC